MEVFLYLSSFFFGTIIGSFLNVVICRYNTGRSLGGRSRCLSCNRELSWYELIPVLGFFIVRGRCRYCRSSISPRYPIIEFLAGLLFMFAAIQTHVAGENVLFTLASLWLAAGLLLVIAAYDLNHKIIPDGFAYAFIVLSFIAFAAREGLFSGIALADIPLWKLFSGPLFSLPFVLLWLFSRGRVMGLGDAKLVCGIGWFLPPLEALSAVVIAFWAGALWSVALLFLKNKTFTMKSEVPFGPFLVFGFFVALFFHVDVTGLSAFL